MRFQTEGLPEGTSATVVWTRYLPSCKADQTGTGSTTFSAPGQSDWEDAVPVCGESGLNTFLYAFPATLVSGGATYVLQSSTPPSGASISVDTTIVAVYALACTAPSITTHPQSQTKTVGDPASFSVIASGTAPLSYQWQRWTGTDWTNIGSGGSTYSISSVTFADAGDYRVIVSNACGSTTSNVATLTVVKATTVVTLSNLNQVYSGDPLYPTATTNPPNLPIVWTNAPQTNAGIYIVTATVDHPDYQGSASATFVIHKADPSCSIQGWEGTYDGEPYGASGSCIGVKGETLAALDLGETFTNVPGGTAHWSFVDQTGNYNDASGSVDIVIHKALLTVTANDRTKVLNAPNPDLTYSIAGFVEGEDEGVIDTLPTCSTTSNQFSPVGSYPITCSGGEDNNYDFAYVPVTLRIIYASGGYCHAGPGHQILQPINADGSSVFKQKSTVPVKFRVCDAYGNSIGTPGVVSSFVLYTIANGGDGVWEQVESTTPDTTFRWSANEQQWIFNLSTKNLQANKTYFYRISLNDGTAIEFSFKLK